VILGVMREGPLNLSPSSTLRKPKTPSRLLYCPSTRRKDILSQMSTMKLVSTSAYFLLLRSTTQAFPKPSIFSQPRFFSSSTTMSAKPFAVVVEAEIQPDRMEEFLAMIETNAINSRKEPGCLRFGMYEKQGHCKDDCVKGNICWV